MAMVEEKNGAKISLTKNFFLSHEKKKSKMYIRTILATTPIDHNTGQFPQ